MKLAIDWNRFFEFAWRILVFVVAIGIIIVVSTNWTRWEGGAGWQRTNDAYLQADLTPIAAKVAGYVRELPIQDFERVHRGQVLAQLADDDYRAAMAQAAAGVATAAAQSQALNAQHALQIANLEAARAAVESVDALADQNARDLARQRRLLETGSSSAEAGERLATTHAQLEAQRLQARAQARAAERQLAVLEAQISQSEAAVGAQRAALDAARINLGYTTITAPQDGVLGQRAEITVDAFPGHTLRGHVLAFAPASGAEFALLPPDNATGNFTKVVQRIAVKIAIDEADGLAERLVPGMSVEANVDAREGRR